MSVLGAPARPIGLNDRAETFLDRECRGIGLVVAAAVALLAVLPVMRLGVAALAPGGVFAPARAIAEITSRAAVTATWNTLEVGLLSSIGALVIGSLFALGLVLTDIRAKRALAFLFVFGLLIAPQVIALAFKMLAGPASPLLQAVGLAPPAGTPNPLLGRAGIVLVLALHHAPLVAIILAAGLRAIPNGVVEAAMLDGARPLQIVRAIVLPLVSPHLAAAGVLAFVAGCANFGIPALLGIPAGYLTLPTLIYRRIASFGPQVLTDAAALAVLVALVAGLGVLAGAYVLRRATTRYDTDAPLRPITSLGRWRPLAQAMAWLVIVASCLLPMASLAATALVASYGIPLSAATATLENFAEVLLRQSVTVRAIRNSLSLAALAAVGTAVLSVAIAYALDRRFVRWRVAVVTMLEIPYAVPGIVLAVAMILLFLKPLPVIGISIYGTPVILLIAYLSRFIAVALKAPVAAMASLSREQEEAAATDGARLGARFRRIVLPHLLPSAMAGALLVFLMAFNELTVSALLWSAGTETLGVALLSLEEAGLVTEAAALGAAAAVLVGAIMLALDRLSTRLPENTLPWSALVPPASSREQVRQPK